MNGTPFISEVYAVLGNPHPPAATREVRVSLVVLTRGLWQWRPQVLSEFHSLGFFEILCMETSVPRYDTESLLHALPGLRLLVDQSRANAGALINRAAREARGERFLVVWDDQSVDQTLVLRLLRPREPALALAPDRRDPNGRELPSVLVPVLDRDRFKILALGADEENVDTLFPADYTALYDRQRFLQTGGYDAQAASPFWQKADWGLRSRLWGERLVVDRELRLDYRQPAPPEDQTPDESYPRFYLRNLAVRHAGDHGVLPLTRLWSHARRSGLSWWAALADFLKQREWVRLHRYRFQADARHLTELWGTR